MPYVKRDENGDVVAAYADAQSDAPEFMEPDSAALGGLMAPSPEASTRQSLTQSDLDLVRVLEDLVTALLSKNVIQQTDLPEEARAKILQRRRMRGELDQLAGLVMEEETAL